MAVALLTIGSGTGSAAAQLLPPPSQAPAPPVVPAGAPGDETTHVGADATRRSWVAAAGFQPPLRSLWRVELGSRGPAPVVGGGRVYVGVGYDDVVALDLASGRQLWRATGANGALSYGSNRVVSARSDRGVVALDATTGQVRWTSTELISPTSVVIAGDLAIVQGNGLHAYDLESGAKRWKAQLTASGDGGPPAASGDRVYFRNGCIVAAADRRTGRVLWQRTNSCFGGAMLHRDLMYPGDANARPLRALDGTEATGRSADAIADDIGLLALSGNMQGIDLASGQVRWVAKATARFGDRALVLGDNVVRGSIDGLLEIRGLPDGKERWAGQLIRAKDINGEHSPAFAAGGGVLLVRRGATLDALARQTTARGSVPVRLPRVRAIEARELVKFTGTVTTSLLPRLRVEADEYPYGRYTRQGKAVVPDARGNYELKIAPVRNTRVRVADETGASGASRRFTLYVYPRFRFNVRNVSNRVTTRITVTGGARVRFRGRRVVLYVGRSARKRLVRLGSARISGPPTRRGRAAVRFAALRGVGRRDFLFACIPGIHRAGQGAPDAVQRRCGRASIRY